MDPGIPFYQGPKPVFDTNSQKTDTIVLRKPLYAVRSAGIGIQRAQKKPLLAPFGGTIAGWIDLQYLKTERTPVLGIPGSGYGWFGAGTMDTSARSQGELRSSGTITVGYSTISPTVTRSRGSQANDRFFLVGCKKWRIPVHEKCNTLIACPVYLNSV